MAGGIKELEGYKNSLEIIALARFAVNEHNNKEVRAFLLGLSPHKILDSILIFRSLVNGIRTLRASFLGRTLLFSSRRW